MTHHHWFWNLSKKPSIYCPSDQYNKTFSHDGKQERRQGISLSQTSQHLEVFGWTPIHQYWHVAWEHPPSIHFNHLLPNPIANIIFCKDFQSTQLYALAESTLKNRQLIFLLWQSLTICSSSLEVQIVNLWYLIIYILKRLSFKN